MKIKVISLFLALMLMLCACGASAEPVEYVHSTGLSITMPEGFQEMHAESFLGGYKSTDLVVNVVFNEELYESLSNVGIDPNMTLAEYGQLILDAHGFEGTSGTSENGIPYIRYTQVIEDVDVVYYAYFYENDVAFWTVTFMCALDEEQNMEPQFAQWASTVQIPAEAVTEPYNP